MSKGTAHERLTKERDHVEDRAVNASLMYIEQAPPARIVAFVTLFTSTLDVLADILMCLELIWQLPYMTTDVGVKASYAYFFFTAVSLIVYVVEMIDVFHTLKYGEENLLLARWAKSLLIAVEEVPLTLCLYLLYTHEQRLTIARPAVIIACIKLIALTWGITKFIKMRFCYPCLPCTMHHGFAENTRRCLFRPTFGRFLMLLVNISHAIAIVLVILILIAATTEHPDQFGGGK